MICTHYPCVGPYTHFYREHLQLKGIMKPEADLQRWTELATSVDNFTKEVKIAIVGKYTGLSDSYLSVIKVR